LTSTGVILQGHQSMKQEGAIILCIGGDNSNWVTGYFSEGVMTKGMPSAKLWKRFRGILWLLVWWDASASTVWL
jgi:Alpha-L-arabinofuranosidase B, catalytic